MFTVLAATGKVLPPMSDAQAAFNDMWWFVIVNLVIGVTLGVCLGMLLFRACVNFGKWIATTWTVKIERRAVQDESDRRAKMTFERIKRRASEG